MATSKEDLIASDEIEESEPKVSADLNCPLCQKVFRSPRRLPCSHSFCRDCLQSHISDTVSVNGPVKEFFCPICGNEYRSNEEIPTDKWVLLFPLNTLMLSVLMKSDVKLDLLCNVCQAEDVTSPAEDLCTVCEEALCGKCSKVHKWSRLSTTHTVLKLTELPSKQDIVLNNHTMFHCTEHAHNPVELYCIIHQTLLCTKCLFARHRNCSKVVELSNEEPYIPDTLKQMKEQMQFLEHQLKTTFKNISVSNLSHVETKVNELHFEIQALKKTINDALDDLDMRVKEEGMKILEKEKERIEQLNYDCESHIMAIRNSNVVVESASKYATQSQMFQLTKTMINQLSMSQRHIEDKYSKKNRLTFLLEVNPQLQSISAIPRGEIGRLRMKRNDERPILCDGFKLLNECIAEPLILKGVQATGDMTPWFTSLTFTTDMQVLLVDYNNQTCNLLDSTYDTITSYQLSGKPWHICMIGEKEAAITFPHDKSIHILSIQDNSITPIRQICTQYMCYGIAAYNEELIVSGPCDDGKKYYWSLITLEGKEKSYHVFDCRGKSQTYVALNALKTRLYISVHKDNSLHCFGLDGRKYFTFTHRELKGPQGVALDRDDNVYVLVGEPNNILQLSPDLSLNQIIVEDLKKSPMGICFDHHGDKFVLTHFETTNLSVYILKNKDG